MQSRVYEGKVRHRRFSPGPHEFSYSLFMMYLDLSELDQVFKGRLLWSAERPNLASFYRKNYWGDPSIPLDRAIRDAVKEKTGREPQGPIRMLTHLSYFGYCYNPVSFYYCFDSSGTRVETIAADINNTPWNEHKLYILDESMNEAREPGKKRYRFAKDFHISPFMPMDIDYDWRFEEPGEAIAIHMENFRQGGKIFDATLTLERREINSLQLARVLVSYPLMTVKVIFGIYWQAVWLWLKKNPFHTHPAKISEAEAKP